MTPRLTSIVGLTGLMLSTGPFSAQASAIENACLSSERGSGQSILCGCIQDAADQTLTKGDQKLAATFFSNPQRAQDIRQSSRRHHERFWERYEAFGEVAQAFCR
ncbi:MAG: hypothetical protein OXQ92_16520 [Boseongicola sp.]|nr:hypothetical protein [Boseongicola sp.]MDD9978306.1 hypothetical protein [Boseongicola sp.]